MGSITVGGQETATNTDVLNGTRLVTVGVGKVVVECSASDYIAANHYTVSLTLPGGNAPWLDVPVPQGQLTAGTTGILDDRLLLLGSFMVTREGHVTLSFTEVGDTEVSWRVTSIT